MLIGSAADGDTLSGIDAPAVFDLAAGEYSSAGSTLKFSGFEILKGGNETDVFVLDESAGFIGSILGGGGHDVLDYRAWSSPVTVNLQTRQASGLSGTDTFAFSGSGALSGNIDGGAGVNTLDYSWYTSGSIQVSLGSVEGSGTATALAGSFSNIRALVGSTRNDDVLNGPDTDTIFTISGQNAGTVNGSFSFSAMEILNGGAGNDTFAFTGSGALSGQINGGDGSNTLDYSGYGLGVTVDLQNATATGISKFSGIQALIGSAYSDTLLEPDSGATFTIDAPMPAVSAPVSASAVSRTLQAAAAMIPLSSAARAAWMVLCWAVQEQIPSITALITAV